MGLTHGFQNQCFHNDLPIKGISEHTSCRCQLFKKYTHHITVRRQSSQLPVGGNGFRRFVKDRFGLRKQRTKLHCTERSQHLLKQSFEILASFSKFCNNGNDSSGIVAEHGACERIQIPPVGQTEKGKNLISCNSTAVPSEKKGNHLIQKGLCITHPTLCRPCNGGNSFRFHRHFFGFGNERKTFSDQLGGDGLQIKALTAGNNGGQHLMDLSRCKDELHMLGRLFNGFKQNVPSHFGKHVDLINDVDLVFSSYRTGQYIVSQFPHGFSIVAAGGVDLDHIKRTLLSHGTAVFTLTAGFSVNGRKAVESFGKNTRQRGFTYAPGTYKEISMPGTVLSDGVPQGTHNMLLPHHI